MISAAESYMSVMMPTAAKAWRQCDLSFTRVCFVAFWRERLKTEGEISQGHSSSLVALRHFAHDKRKAMGGSLRQLSSAPRQFTMLPAKGHASLCLKHQKMILTVCLQCLTSFCTAAMLEGYHGHCFAQHERATEPQ